MSGGMGENTAVTVKFESMVIYRGLLVLEDDFEEENNTHFSSWWPRAESSGPLKAVRMASEPISKTPPAGLVSPVPTIVVEIDKGIGTNCATTLKLRSGIRMAEEELF